MPRSYASSALFDNGAAAGGDRATSDRSEPVVGGPSASRAGAKSMLFLFSSAVRRLAIIVGVVGLANATLNPAQVAIGIRRDRITPEWCALKGPDD
jgi:hypothetical protein